jgi:YhcH/YjgK/YiaL family protein
MMTDRLDRFGDYCAKGSLLEKGFAFFRHSFSADMPDGRHDIDGNNCFALVQSYTTQKSADKKWEAHLQYIDIQYMAQGEEIVEYVPARLLTESENLTPKSDVIFYAPFEGGTNIVLKKGDFAVFFPQDAHKPGVILKAPVPVKKVVVKVRY